MEIVDVKPLGGFRLFLKFNDGVSGSVDLSPIAGRGVFASWLNEGLFEKVIITDVGALEWPGELDLCPDSLYLQITGKQPEELFPSLDRKLTHA